MLAVQHPTWNSSQRTTVLIGGVVLLHVLGLWALHTGLLQRATEWVIPVVMVSEMPPMAVKPPPPPPPLTPSPPAPAQRAAHAPTPLALAPLPTPQPTQTPAAPPTIAATGARVNSKSDDNFASPKILAPASDAAIPAKKTTSPPGKTRPINSPVSIKIMARTPIKPSVEMIEFASKKFTVCKKSIP